MKARDITDEAFDMAVAHTVSALRTFHCAFPGDNLDRPCRAPATHVLLSASGRGDRDDQPFCAEHTAASRALFARINRPVTFQAVGEYKRASPMH